MIYLYVATSVLLLLSLLRDRQRTARALRIAARRFLKIAPSFLCMLMAVSLALYALPKEVLMKYLGQENRWLGLAIASGLGSISIMPGFIAFPLASILRGAGVAYMVLSAFTTTLMMVGIVTFPVEQSYLGTKAAILRNLAGLGIALVVALATGLVFGEWLL
jgi:uncharacterized membrane protein YraQ (UPF0718 family)